MAADWRLVHNVRHHEISEITVIRLGINYFLGFLFCMT